MGTWGTGLLSDDQARDIYDEFRAKYNAGKSPQKIREQIEREWRGSFEPNEVHLLDLVLAKCLWETGALNDELLERVRNIITTKVDLSLWEELDATKSDIKKREKVLINFLEKISQKNPKPRKPRKIKLRNSIYEAGDCLTFQYSDQDFGAVIILKNEQNTEYGLNIMAVLDYKSKAKPSTEEMLAANLMIVDFRDYHHSPNMSYVYAQAFRKSKDRFEKVGHVKLKRDHDCRSYTGSWEYPLDLAEQYHNDMANIKDHSMEIPARDLIQKPLLGDKLDKIR